MTYIPGGSGEPGPPGPAGPSGATGESGFPGLDAESFDEPLIIPGPTGPAGASVVGPAGATVFMQSEPGEDGPMGPPGAQGVQGISGIPGQPGPIIFMEAEPGEDGMVGPPGPAGPQGPAGGGGSGLTEFTKDLGVSRRSGTFDITGLSGLTPDKVVSIVQTATPIASKGNARDEPEMDLIRLTGYVVNATTIRAYWQSAGVVVGIYAFAYAVSG